MRTSYLLATLLRDRSYSVQLCDLFLLPANLHLPKVLFVPYLVAAGLLTALWSRNRCSLLYYRSLTQFTSLYTICQHYAQIAY